MRQRGGERDPGPGPRAPGRSGEPAVGKGTLVQQLQAAMAQAPRATARPSDHPEAVRTASVRGVEGPSGALPHLDVIQRAFGHHDVSQLKAHVGPEASAAAAAMGADAFATGDHVVFDGPPSLHTVAHEAAHAVQQRGTVQLAGGVGAPGDRHEQHADAVADLVVQGQSAQALLDEHGGGPSERSSASATQRSPIQCKIVIHPEQFFRGTGVGNHQVPSQALVREYLDIAVQDEANALCEMLERGDDEWTDSRIRTYIERGDNERTDSRIRTYITDTIAQARAAQPDEYLVPRLGQLFLVINHELGQRRGKSTSETRYSIDPQGGFYHHSDGPPMWRDNKQMTSGISNGIGSGEFNNTKSSRGLPLSQVPWATAKTMFPRPLINLLFDVRYQVEQGEQYKQQEVVDERTPDEQRNKTTEPTQPGSLRSWHQDSNGILPANNFNDLPRPESKKLHDHYESTSGTGVGSSTKNELVTSPQGFAEYTGAGGITPHDLKVVLDYVNKRIYVTFTHYKYWALVDSGGEYQFYDCGTQELTQAKARLQSSLTGGTDRHGRKLNWGDHPTATLMSPWLEILMPTLE